MSLLDMGRQGKLTFCIALVLTAEVLPDEVLVVEEVLEPAELFLKEPLFSSGSNCFL